MNKELHLIVLWQNARYKQKEILEDIQKSLKISECIEIEWSKENVSSNFTRFYGVKLPNRSFKEKECGVGKFLLISVWDENPQYEYVETSRGFEYINKNIFNLKTRYRSWTGGGCKIHSTNTVPEVNHDITLLLGKNYEDYIKEAPLAWNGEVTTIKRDLTGCNSWKNIKELFYTLNATVNYVVLRGIEDVNNYIYDDVHSDLDIFTYEYKNIVYIVNGIPQINKHRPHYLIKVGEEKRYIDIWNANNNYYDTNWQKNMLKTKKFDKGIYKLNDENSFFELIYHCLIHKQIVANIYYDIAKNLFEKLGFDKKYNIADYKYPFDLYYKILIEFMKINAYSFIKPLDKSVYYNENYTNYDSVIEWLNTNYKFSNLKPYMLGVLNTESGYQFLTGDFKGKHLFIKWGGMADSVVTEYKMGKDLYNNNSKNFIEPILFNYANHNNFIATEYTEGTMLSDIMQKNLLTESQKKSYVQQFEEIADSLIKTGIIHRDIRPDNIMVTNNGTLKLIDLQYAVYLNKFTINRMFLKNIYALKNLGGTYNANFYCWDDMFSINKIINRFNEQSYQITKLIGRYRINLFYVRYILYIIKFFKSLYKKLLFR